MTTLLAIDEHALPLRQNVCLYLSKPTIRAEPVLAPRHGDLNAPDNAAAHFYGAVIFEGGRYRMWYYACHWRPADDNTPGGRDSLGDLREGPICYVESTDGIRWERPDLGQVEWRGVGRRNNVIRTAELRITGVHVIRDDEDPDPSRRYKMVYTKHPPDRPWWTIRAATSPDGLAWTDGAEMPYDGFIEQASLYKFGGMYYVNGQMRSRSEGGHEMGRQSLAIVSPDFSRWVDACGESFMVPEPSDPSLRGGAKPYDQAHIGVGAARISDNVLVGLYCLWHNHPKNETGDWFGMGTTTGDFGLVLSNDGLHFREPVKGHVWMHRDDSPPLAMARPGTPHARILCQGNGILNVGNQTLIYHGRWANTEDLKDYHAEIALATLPRDRWGALGLFPDATEGCVWTAPLRVPKGAQLTINADGASGMRVEVADDRFELLPGWSGAQAGTIASHDGLGSLVGWPAHKLPELADRTIRLRVNLQKSGNIEPRLYAMYLAS